jgi:ABC-type glycerol-3-phosphate transport system permease component
MRGFFEAVPQELEESAQIEGCTRLQSVYHITFPLARPGLAAAAIYVFIMVWNDFLFAFTLTISDEMRLLQVGLYHYITAFGVEWHTLTAALIIALLPVVLIFLLLQKQFIRGLVTGAGK